MVKRKISGKVWFTLFLIFWVCLGVYIFTSDWFPRLNRVIYGMVFDWYFFITILIIIFAFTAYEERYPEYTKEDCNKGRFNKDWRGYDETSDPPAHDDSV